MRSQNISDFTSKNVTNIAKQSLFSDLDASFKRNIFTSDIYLKKDIEAVKASIVNIILTGKYERPFQPGFGSNIRSFLFENIDSNIVDSMRDVIISLIKIYEPRAEVLNIDINESELDDNTLRISVQFLMKSTDLIGEANMLLERIR